MYSGIHVFSLANILKTGEQGVKESINNILQLNKKKLIFGTLLTVVESFVNQLFAIIWIQYIWYLIQINCTRLDRPNLSDPLSRFLLLEHIAGCYKTLHTISMNYSRSMFREAATIYTFSISCPLLSLQFPCCGIKVNSSKSAVHCFSSLIFI